MRTLMLSIWTARSDLGGLCKSWQRSRVRSPWTVWISWSCLPGEGQSECVHPWSATRSNHNTDSCNVDGCCVLFWMGFCVYSRCFRLPFRCLVRKYDCDVCFTPMIIAADFMRSAKARDSEFTTNKSKLSLLVVLEASGSQLLSWKCIHIITLHGSSNIKYIFMFCLDGEGQ